VESVSNVSSEEELLKLREEGKVSEAEYQELLEAIRRSPAGKSDVKSTAEPEFQAFRKRILVGSFIICILGVIFGFVLKIPLVWGLGIFGIIVIPIKFHLTGPADGNNTKQTLKMCLGD
jgi:hypothetical protein